MTSNINLGDYFDSMFSLVVANNSTLKQEAYQIRYQVYCQELHYESQDNFPDQMEQDEFDQRSIHILLKHKATNAYIGCVRLVLADKNQDESPFPFEKYCQHNINFKEKPRKNYCEVSRLAVRGEFRRRKGEENTAQGLLFFKDKPPQEIQERRIASLIPMSLYLACTSITLRRELVMFTLMEARLARQLRIFDIPSHQIGNLVEFKGKRSPFLIDPKEIIQKIKPENRQLLESINSSISQSFPYKTPNITKNQLSLSDLPNFSQTATALA